MRPLVSIAALVLFAGALAGCDAKDKVTGPDPDKAADALAAALATGDFADVAFTDDQTPTAVGADYAEVVDGLGDLTPTVTAGGVEEDGDSATATLAWVWPVGGDEWSYTTDVTMTKFDDEWQVPWSRALVEPSLRKATVLDATPIAGRRGDIVGNRGTALVTDRDVVRFGIDRGKVSAARAGASARAFAQLVGIDPTAYAKRVEASGPKAFVEAITLRKDDVPLDVAQRYFRIKGGVGIPGQLPLAPSRDFALPILGTVGDVTAEMIKDHPDRYEVGDLAGLSGLQARYDEQLQGVDGEVVHAVGSDGMERELYRVDPQQGRPLQITLDLQRQTAAEAALAGVGPAAALVAVRPSDGAILAAANGAGTDGYNVATYGQAAPGSTFKTVSSLALLRAGLKPGTVVPCTSRIVVDGKPFENYDDYPSSALGNIPLSTAVANSCNTAFISQAGKVSDGSLAGAAASLGLGVDHDLGFPAYFGQVPAPKSETEAAADLIGQGGVLASPMAMATVMASIESGKTVVPRLVKSVDVSVPDDVEPLTAGEATALQQMLRGVVTSGSGRGLLDVPGPPVIAKTGTAEFERNGKTLTHAWMVAAQGDLAVAVYVDEGSSGSGTAGPILEQFLRAGR
ncbi:penicillin-binding protein [Nocardioides sp. Root1257]|uniref:penicillin-binding transpeptidase domain-containing protein n=1 Tax=unclassified Nocardioides TaxID=2615069 RepID=UPI0006F69F1F|nr:MULTISPECIES: penicillin-binding transpeptidase domain-containing protein [unclassified Nocardioides]KQW47721.1 penicillin-binding protein [Nocardioides sp. Root1257]KRC44973.1 penicillin-binding protein [Nocardioides sp. Root224]